MTRPSGRTCFQKMVGTPTRLKNETMLKRARRVRTVGPTTIKAPPEGWVEDEGTKELRYLLFDGLGGSPSWQTS